MSIMERQAMRIPPIVNLVLACMTISMGIWTCAPKKSGDSGAREFPVIAVNKMDVETDVYFVADIQAVRNVEIRARVNGYLEKIFVDEGGTVREGQLLFKINDEEYLAARNSAHADLKSAEAGMKSAQVEMERVRILVEKNVLAPTEMDLARAKIEIANAQIDQAKAQQAAAQIKVDQASIRSPFDGVIDRIPNRLGSLISEGTLVTTLSDISAMNVYFKVSEIDYLRFVRSNENAIDSLMKVDVELVLADGSINASKGRIETVQNEFEEGTGALALRARFANKGNLLKHGSTGRLKIHRLIKDAVVVPQKSVMEIQDKNYVFVVDKNNQVRLQSFLPLARHEGLYIVSEGLAPGERIIYEGVENLREGSVIVPVETAISAVYKTPGN
jgi:membrane fusion protein (multidrug efflux system)